MTRMRCPHSRANRALICLDALQSNWNLLKSKLGNGVGMLPMVKANAYGHGDFILAEALTKLGAVGVGVADVIEGIQLRENGFKEPIFSFGGISKTLMGQAMENNISMSLHTKEEIDVLEDMSLAKKPPIIHVEIETGMHRLGLEKEDWLDVAKTRKR